MNDLLNPYNLAVKNGGIFDFSYRGKIHVAGKDRVSFLHRMLTNDIQSLKPGQGCYSCLLTSQAKIITDMNVLIFENHVLISVESDYLAKTVQTLEKFIIADDVTLKNVTDEITAFAVFGNNSESTLSELIKNSELPNRHFDHTTVLFNQKPIEAVRIPFYGTRGWVLLVPSKEKESIWKSLLVIGKSKSVFPINQELKETLRIEGGIPACGIDFTEENLLLETGLESRAVSFTKGCYPGQEIVARMDSRGKFAKKLARIVIDSDIVPKPGEILTKDGKEIGKITSAVFSPKFQKPIALGYIARDYFKKEEVLQITIGAQKHEAHLLV